MDLDQLKDIWQGLDQPVGEQQGKQEILALLKKRSQGPIAKMKRNLQWELILVIVSYTAVITHYFTAFDKDLQSVAWFLLVIGLLFLAYYYKKNKLLNEMQHVSGKVKVHLERQVNTLEKFVRFYLFAGAALVPACLAFFGWIFYNELPDLSTDSIFFSSDKNPTWKAVGAWTLLTLILTVLVYFANKWLLDKLYGNHIRKLRHIVAEMSEE
ncbi:MAG: hypothetical protein EOO92_17135 [Pedobacter sp.]|nr:MAG: hypothetical protein EOO92_17135 [Pedobacter sp.]